MELKKTIVIDVGPEKIDGLDQLSITIEYLHTEDGFEVFEIYYEEYDAKDLFKIEEWAMDISREIEKEGNGPVFQFVWLMYVRAIREGLDAKEARDFFEDISDWSMEYTFLITQGEIFNGTNNFIYIDGTTIRIGDITRWCQDNLKTWNGYWNYQHEYVIVIKNIEESMAFKLRWE